MSLAATFRNAQHRARFIIAIRVSQCRLCCTDLTREQVARQLYDLEMIALDGLKHDTPDFRAERKAAYGVDDAMPYQPLLSGSWQERLRVQALALTLMVENRMRLS